MEVTLTGSVGYKLPFFNATKDIGGTAAHPYPGRAMPTPAVGTSVDAESTVDRQMEVIAVDQPDPATAGQPGLFSAKVIEPGALPRAPGPGRRLKPGLPHLPEPATRAGRPSPPPDLASLWVDVLSPARWEPCDRYDGHLSHSSAGATCPVDVEIVVP